jgi:acetoin:2,6-dichlorophenolindophenol oxidoreductase subunit alpha
MGEPATDVRERMFSVMTLIKTCDERLRKGIGSGEFMTVFWPPRGQEAIAAGIATTLRPDDRLVTTYRGLHDLLAKGVPLREVLGEMLGRQLGACRGKGGTMHVTAPAAGVMLSTGIVGAGVPVAVGLALAARRAGSDRVVLVSFGDGATNTGSFHEAANLASTWQLPVVLVCQNNLYAEMTPIGDTMHIAHVAERAGAYAMPGRTVDGNDPVEVHAALTEAVGRARDGGGPTLVECVTFRFNGHFFGDPMAYIPPEQLQRAIAADPVPRFRARLIADGVLTDERAAEIESEAGGAVEDALQDVLRSDPPALDEVDRDIYDAATTGVPR